MSLDITIWSRKPLLAAQEELAKAGFAAKGAGYCLEGKTWLINAATHPVKDEDVPEGAASLLPGIGFVTHMTLEPATAPAAALARFMKIAATVAKKTGGVVEDRRDGGYTLPAGGKKYVPPKQGERFSVLALSWWFETGAPATREGMRGFLQLLEKRLPEALPRRYGGHEPPPFVWAETGIEHFLDQFLARNAATGIVCYTTKPAVGLRLGIKEPCGFTQVGRQRKYRSHQVTVSFDAAVLGDPAWQARLREAWTELSLFLMPFYGDIRILKNYIGGRAVPYLGAGTESHPVASWWWRGIPEKPALAAVLGPPYARFWPAFRQAAHERDGFFFLAPPDWAAETDISTLAGPPPRNITAPAGPAKLSVTAEEARIYIEKLRKGEIAPADSYTLPEIFPFSG
jgi:hypothetical protein